MHFVSKKKECGFTPIELLITIAIGGIVMAAMVSTFVAQRKSYVLQEQINEMVYNARAAMELMIREIRMAGYNTEGPPPLFDDIVYDPDVIRIQADLNNSGSIDGQDEQVSYFFDESNLLIIRNSDYGDQTLADNIQDFTFDYLDEDDNSTNDSDKIRKIKVTIIARTPKPDPGYPNNAGHRTFTLDSVITLRNRR